MDCPVTLIPGLEPGLAERVVDRLLALEPGAIAVLVSGSYAKGLADENSDLDVQVVTGGEPVSPYRMWFEERLHAKPLHVSPSAKSLEGWLRKRNEPQGWAFGFPVEHVVRYVWSTDAARAALGDPPNDTHPPAEPELEDLVEALHKVRRCAAHRDAAGIRMFGRVVAALAPGLLRLLNPEVVVRDPRQALEAARSLPVAPAHYRLDFDVSYGLVESSDESVERAVMRLGRELLAFLRTHKPDVDPQPDIAGYLADGTIERHLGFLG
jgi:hypothetical protein